jgi:diaminohydroxyphosphoribosylaminopyrimidine deaminase/5-amino-6-(5-phosphoribosylamino)uracil reductase
MLRDSGSAGCNELHVEAGHKLNGSLLRAGPGGRCAGLPGAADGSVPVRACRTWAARRSWQTAWLCDFRSSDMVGADLYACWPAWPARQRVP